jgi:hypothetical protein
MSVTFEGIDQSWARLKKVISDYDFAIFLGAGISIPNKIPSWAGLTGMLTKKNEVEVTTLERSGISFSAQIGIAKNALEAQGDDDWIESIRSSLYRATLEQIENPDLAIPGLSRKDLWRKDDASRARIVEFFRKTNPLLLEIVKSCSIKSGTRYEMTQRIGAILTTNLDCFIQICDRAYHGTPRILRTVERSNTETDAEKIPLYHLHGYLQVKKPLPGHEAADRLVLTEDEYLERNDNPYSWASVIMHWGLREFPVIFIGCSMNDELMRRALRRLAIERIKDLRAERGGRSFSEKRWRRHFTVALWSRDLAVNEARNASLASLGVWPLWVKDYDGDLLTRAQELLEWARRIT